MKKELTFRCDACDAILNNTAVGAIYAQEKRSVAFADVIKKSEYDKMNDLFCNWLCFAKVISEKIPMEGIKNA